MRWVTNYDKLAAATLFTLFFGGNDFAPKTLVDGQPIQDFLQQHYFNAIKAVATFAKEMPHVLGYDIINEPSPDGLDARPERPQRTPLGRPYAHTFSIDAPRLWNPSGNSHDGDWIPWAAHPYLEMDQL